MASKLKACFLIPTVSSGGIETYLLRFIRFIKEELDITVLVRGNEKGDLLDSYRSTGVDLIFLPLGYLNLLKAVSFYSFFKQRQFDLVCDFNANFAGPPMFLARMAKVEKRIAFYRQGRNHFRPSLARNAVNSFFNKLVYWYSTDILSNSYAAMDFFFPYRKENDQRFSVIYNGVNIEDYSIAETKEEIRRSLNLQAVKYVIGHVGRLDEAKNHGLILSVFKQLSNNDSNYHLLLCGENIQQLKSQVEKVGISSYTLLGYRNDVPRILKALDCFIFPSWTEGQPNALIEAMVSGVPFVASNINAIKECVPALAHEFLFDPGDIQSFCNGIDQIRKNDLKVTITQEYAMSKFDKEQRFVNFFDVIQSK